MSNEPRNTLQQDLMLLAKNHYKATNIVAAGRLVCSWHVLCPYESLTIVDLVHWLLKEFVEPEHILPGRERLSEFIFKMAKAEDDRMFWGRLSIPTPEPRELVAHRLFDQIYAMRVRDDGVFIEPWMEASVDPAFVALLQKHDLLEKEHEAG